MTKKVNKRKLRNYLINLGIQRRIIVINIIFMILVLILTMTIIYTHMFEGDIGVIGVWHFAIGDLTMSLSTKLFILYSLLAMTFIFAISTLLWITHRVCGALVNFMNTFKKISAGDLNHKISLRKDDLLKEEANQFNEMMEEVSQKVAVLQKDNEYLRSRLNELTDTNGAPEKTAG